MRGNGGISPRRSCTVSSRQYGEYFGQYVCPEFKSKNDFDFIIVAHLWNDTTLDFSRAGDGHRDPDYDACLKKCFYQRQPAFFVQF